MSSDKEDGLAPTYLQLLRYYFFGQEEPPLSSGCSWRDVLQKLKELSEKPRRAPPWRLAFGLAEALQLHTQVQRLRWANEVLAPPADSALAELLELVRVLGWLLGVSPHELLDYIVTGVPPYGMPWWDLRADGTVLVGGTPRGVAGLVKVLGWAGSRRPVPREVFEEFLATTKGMKWSERVDAWNQEWAPRLEREFRTVSALRKAIWTARRRGRG